MPSASRSRPPHAAASPSAGAATSAPSAPRRETDPKKRVVITRMGLVSAFGDDVDALYEKLLEGEGGIGNIDRFDASKFPTKFAGQIRGFSSEGYIDEKNDRRLDDYLRLTRFKQVCLLEQAWMALQCFLIVIRLLYRKAVGKQLHFLFLMPYRTWVLHCLLWILVLWV